MTRSIFAATVVALAASACATTSPRAVDAYDLDRDGYITAEEYHAVADDTGYFVAWDSDGDGYLDATEYRMGLQTAGHTGTADFTTWDLDRDQRLTRAELYTGTFATLDLDDDDRLDADEIEGGVVEAGYWVEP